MAPTTNETRVQAKDKNTAPATPDEVATGNGSMNGQELVGANSKASQNPKLILPVGDSKAESNGKSPLRRRKEKQKKASAPATSGSTSSPRRRRRGCIELSLQELAVQIVKEKKNVVFVTGAGLSAASGIRPFRTSAAELDGADRATLPDSKVGLQEGLWNDVIWTTATRKCFRKDPAKWYNTFWLPHFSGQYKPNAGHIAMDSILKEFPNVRQLTQNIDGLQEKRPNAKDYQQRLLEVHGRVGLYKCLPDEDSDGESSSDESDTSYVLSGPHGDKRDRQVYLGSRRTAQKLRQANIQLGYTTRVLPVCPYQYWQSLTVHQLEPADAREVLSKYCPLHLNVVPTCPSCGNFVLPQALLFDEGYHSHSFYQFEVAEAWLEEAEILVFVGTSWSVRLTNVALDHARDCGIPVYNINLHDLLESTARLNAVNMQGLADEIMPKLFSACQALQQEMKQCDKAKSGTLENASSSKAGTMHNGSENGSAK